MPGKIDTKSTANTDQNRSARGGFFVPSNASKGRLTLGDGQVFHGQLLGPTKPILSEVVFNTGMTGYVESLTDPSYTGQILVFTYPLIGNYGVDMRSGESGRVQASGVIVSEAAMHWSHAGAAESLQEWLQAAGVPGVPLLTGVDTRALTKHLRTRGTMAGAISAQPFKAESVTLKPHFVSINKPKVYNPAGKKKVILVDCGAKENIVRSLVGLGVKVKRVPHDYDYTHEDYDGVMLSNGPGDPTDYAAAITIARKAMQSGKPIFGICLGSQLMALASGARTYKLKFGHRGHNQPCQEASGRCYITSQNHGYAIDGNSLPRGWRVSFRNLNDGSVEGIEHASKPFFAVQFHPEACPGPTDTGWLFEKFKESL